MAKLIIFLDRLVNYYMYFVLMGCFLSLVPNINPDYPMFRFIFKLAGFYLIPPFWGISFSPMCVLIVLVLFSMGLKKLYFKYFADKQEEHEVIIMSPEEFIEASTTGELKSIIEESEDKKNDRT